MPLSNASLSSLLCACYKPNGKSSSSSARSQCGVNCHHSLNTRETISKSDIQSCAASAVTSAVVGDAETDNNKRENIDDSEVSPSSAHNSFAALDIIVENPPHSEIV
ncbi:hypothetical protein AB6A40_010198 [Gnathostoma spinigerum]|uniref:Uncharacterized protein n=1 Tax=Gnathostoma spinigerum TaxID=75299 RepID=A0ABD6EU38_9BILA